MGQHRSHHHLIEVMCEMFNNWLHRAVLTIRQRQVPWGACQPYLWHHQPQLWSGCPLWGGQHSLAFLHLLTAEALLVATYLVLTLMFFLCRLNGKMKSSFTSVFIKSGKMFSLQDVEEDTEDLGS